MGDYVAVSPLFITRGKDEFNCFARRNGVLVKEHTCTKEIKIGDTIKVELRASNDGYTACLGDEEAITGGFDFKLTAIDPENVYVGFFVSRFADVTFSDIKLNLL